MGLLGDFLGPILSYKGTQDTNNTNLEIANNNSAFNAAQAQLNRDFQADQSATSYQRATKDMQAAGLNPMLAYSQGGASTPSGAQGVAAQVTMQNPLSSAVDAYHRSQERNVMGAQVGNILADTKVKEETANQIVAQTENIKAQERLSTNSAHEATVRMFSQLNYGNPTQKALAASYWSQIDVNKANLPKIASEIASNGAYAAQARAQAEKAIAESKITRADLDRALNDQRYERATGGTIRQTSRDLGNITGAAVNARKAGMTKR
jgi:hypothetical protein